LENGVQAMDPNGGRLSVRATSRRKDGSTWIDVSIADTGHGIPTDSKSIIFDLFFTTKEAGKGFGYGLWRARSIVEAIGGIIQLESEVSKGTIFNIALPGITDDMSGGK